MKNIKTRVQIATGVMLIFGGTLVFFNDYIKEKREDVFSEMNLNLSFEDLEEVEEPEIEIKPEEKPEEQHNEKPEINYEKYLGILKIPKIDFERGFYKKNSRLNHVDYNLYILPEADYPDVINGNFIIAGHSGNFRNSFFKNLYKLNTGDSISVQYNNKEYNYKITNIYNVEKNGKVKIIRNKNKTVITLITCTKNDKKKQTVYIGELI